MINPTLIKKISLLGLLLILVSFNQNVLRCIKLTTLLSIPTAGVELLPFLKLWGLVPAIFFFTSLYIYLIKKFRYNQAVFIIISIFSTFFILFLFILYPNSSMLEISSVQKLTLHWFPKGLYSFIIMVKYWHLSLFYIFSELWGAVILSLLVWGFINENISFEEAKKLYPCFFFITNLASVIAGNVTQIVCLKEPYTQVFLFKTAWEQSFALQLIIVIILCFAMKIIFFKISYLFKHNSKYNTPPKITKSKGTDDSTERGIVHALKLLFQEKILLHIAILVFSYNLIYNLFEVVWLDQVKSVYLESIKLNLYIGKITANVGLFATLASFIIMLLRHFNLFFNNWFINASITPVICFFTTLMFILSLYQVIDIFTVQSTLFFASSQIVLGRVCKYTVFDETKESAFIKLTNNTTRRQGKAIIDLFSFKFGQLIANLVIQILLLVFLNISNIGLYIFGLIFIINFIWYFSVKKLQNLLNLS